MPVIRRAQVRPDFSVEIEWQDSETSIVSFRDTIAKGGRFAQLSDSNSFGRVKVREDGDCIGGPENSISGRARFGIEPTPMLQLKNSKLLKSRVAPHRSATRAPYQITPSTRHRSNSDGLWPRSRQ
jgi:hypothetical protein